jgi:transposase
VDVTEQRTKTDWAHQIKELVDERYPEAQRIVLVMDNLNTHTPASLYEAFEPEEAKRLAEKLEIHYTPKHGSWLNMAEIELSVLSRQCLDRRVPDFESLQAEVSAWQERRDATTTKIEWRFRTEDARIKLKRLYPSLQE